MNIESIKIMAAILNIAGSGILAFRVTGVLSALSLVASAHETNIQQLMPNHKGDIVNLGKSTAHVDKSKKTGLLITGFVLLILSSVLQLTALVMANT
jgi:hypothetical protein